MNKNGKCGALRIGTGMLALAIAGAAAWSLNSENVVQAQAVAATNDGAKQFDLQQPGVQTISLGKFPYGAQRGARIKGEIRIDQGELSGSIVLKMLSKAGEDLAPHQKLLGWYDPTREMALKDLKAGSPIQISEDFVTGPATEAVGVELKVDVKKVPCSLRVSGLRLEERAGDVAEAEEGGQLVTTPAAGFTYAKNLVPAMDSTEWRATGESAKRGRGPGGQTLLLLDEKGVGKWESPVAKLPQGARELCLQAFMKFDRLATPFDHPYQVVFRDKQDKVLTKAGRGWWPSWEWNHAYGQWIPVTLRLKVPENAASVQVVMELNKGMASIGMGTGEMSRNNFVVFQTGGLRLWAEKAPSTAGMSPFNFTEWAGGAGDAGPFVACSPQQQNSIALWSCVNDTSNLYFSKEHTWPAPKVRVENFLPIARTLQLNGEVLDWAGRPVSKVSCPVSVEPFECKNVDLPLQTLTQSGIYSLNLSALQDGATVGEGVIRWGYFTEPSDRADRRDLKYPFCFHSSYSAQGGDGAKYMDFEGRTMKALGVRGFRLQCRLWALNGADSEKAIAGIRNYSDRFHREVWPYMEKYGFDGYISFFPKPNSAIPEIGTPEMEAWKKYVAAAVKAYPEISTFAFGNEEVGSMHTNLDVRPGVWNYKGSMRDYTREFLAAREAALAARPEIKFIVGQASDPNCNVAKLFFQAGGKAKDVQGWAVNSYGNSPATWKNLTDVLTRNGVDLTDAVGLIPEIGYGVPRRGPNRPKAEKGEAISLVISNVETLAAAPWIRDICWFTLVSRGPVVHNFILDTDWSPKPMAGAYLTMSSTLGAGRPKRVEELTGVSAYLWQRPDGSKVGVIWSPGRQRVRVRVGETNGPVIVRDLMGNDTQVTPQGGVVSVEASESPVYVLNIQSFASGADTSESWTLERTADDQWQAKVAIANRTNQPLRIAGHFEGSPLVVWSAPDVAAFTLAPSESKTITAPFALKDKEFSDSKTLTLMLNINGSQFASDFATSLLTARRVATPPSFDGSGKGWEKGEPMVMNELRHVTTNVTPRWKGPDDLSARCTVLWDEQNLYFRAAVKDDTVVQETEVSGMFMNDNIQMGLITNEADKNNGIARLALGVSHGRPAIHLRAGGKEGEATDDQARLKVHRDEAAKTTIYEAAISWKALQVTNPAAGLHLRFAVLVNDSDHPGSKGSDRQAIQWFGGVFDQSPSRYGDVTLSQ